MVKKLQALKAKKGFTLVELIVVIAIIGVLAAILVPTMMGMVTKSRVTSADQTAKGIVDSVTNWIADLEANGGEFPKNDKDTLIVISGTTLTLPDDSGKGGSLAITYSGSYAGQTGTGTDKYTYGRKGKDATDYLSSDIYENYKFNNPITAVVVMQGRKVIGAIYIDRNGVNDKGELTESTVTALATSKMLQGGFYKWDNKNNVGVKDGQIYGTNPKIDFTDKEEAAGGAGGGEGE